MSKSQKIPDRTIGRSTALRLRAVAVTGGLILALSGCLSTGQDEPSLTVADPPQTTPPKTEAAAEELVVDRETIALLQSLLHVAGHDAGPVDGLLGPKTDRAIKTFQLANGRAADGRITNSLMADLEVIAAARAAGPTQAAAAGDEGTAASGSDAGPAAPRYLPGTRYFYSDGKILEVVAVEGTQVHWQSNSGESFTAHRNFLLPPLSWATRDEEGQSVLDSPRDGLWQQTMRAEAAFAATATMRRGEQPDSEAEETEHWRCRRGDSERLTVVAGRFATEKLICERLAADRMIGLVRTWHYAPLLRHFVRRQEIGTSSPASPPVELVAIRPAVDSWPPAAQAGLNWATQHALESLPSGEEQSWSSSAVAPSVVITPGDEIAWAGQQTCRRYRQVWTLERQDWVFPMVACRDTSSAWRFPGLAGADRIAKAGASLNR